MKPLVEKQYRGSRAAQKRIRDIHTNFKNDRLRKARMTLTNVVDTQVTRNAKFSFVSVSHKYHYILFSLRRRPS